MQQCSVTWNASCDASVYFLLCGHSLILFYFVDFQQFSAATLRCCLGGVTWPMLYPPFYFSKMYGFLDSKHIWPRAFTYKGSWAKLNIMQKVIQGMDIIVVWFSNVWLGIIQIIFSIKGILQILKPVFTEYNGINSRHHVNEAVINEHYQSVICELHST